MIQQFVLLGIYPNELKMRLHKNLPTDVHYSLVHNCEHLKATKMSSNWCVDKQTRVYLCSGIWFSDKEKLMKETNSYCLVMRLNAKVTCCMIQTI